MSILSSVTVLTFIVDAGSPGTGEDRIYTFDFSQLPEILDGDTLASSPAPVFTQNANPAAATALTIGTPVLDATATKVQAEFSGGSPGVLYTIYCRAHTTAGRQLICRGKLQTPPLGGG